MKRDRSVVGIDARTIRVKTHSSYARILCHRTRLLLGVMISPHAEIILAHRSRSAKAGPFHENQPESFRHTRRKRMDVENKLKAMGLELPAAGTPPPRLPRACHMC
jgi:hypothetical protein